MAALPLISIRQGYERVINLAGGSQAWLQEGQDCFTQVVPAILREVVLVDQAVS